MEPSVQRGWRTVARVVGLIAFMSASVVLVVVGGLVFVRNEIFDNELPSCDREPVVLEWFRDDGSWRRSTTFELLEDSQKVQVDLSLANEDASPIFNVGRTVYVIEAGGNVPSRSAATPSSTQPFEGVVVGSGIEGVNEQVRLGAGRWELVVESGVSAAEVRWPC